MEAQMFNFKAWVKETNPVQLQKTFTGILKNAGFGILGKVEHHFTPQGYTMLYLLSESHFAIHTFPEHGKAYIELSSCIKNPFDSFINSYKAMQIHLHN